MIATGQYPELVLLNGSPNGVRLNIGQAVKLAWIKEFATFENFIR